MIWLTIMFILLLLWQNWRVAGTEEKLDDLARRLERVEAWIENWGKRKEV